MFRILQVLYLAHPVGIDGDGWPKPTGGPTPEWQAMRTAVDDLLNTCEAFQVMNMKTFKSEPVPFPPGMGRAGGQVGPSGEVELQ